MAGSDEQDSGSSSSTPDVEENPSGYVDPNSFEAFAPDGPADMLIPNPMTAVGAMMQAQHKEQRAERQEALEDGDGFEFTADELRALRDEWQDLTEELNRQRTDLKLLGRAHICPADDDASTSQIQAVNKHAKVCSDIHEQMFLYAKTYAENLDDAVDKLQDSDSAAQESIQSMSKDI